MGVYLHPHLEGYVETYVVWCTCTLHPYKGYYLYVVYGWCGATCTCVDVMSPNACPKVGVYLVPNMVYCAVRRVSSYLVRSSNTTYSGRGQIHSNP